MLKFVSNSVVFNPIHFNILQTLSPIVSYHTNSNFRSTPISQSNVALFWDLDSKPPKTFSLKKNPKPISLFDAAIAVKKGALAFGVLRHMEAFANEDWLRHVAKGKAGKTLGNVTTVVKKERSLCGFCGRKFYNNDMFVKHFKQIHETQYRKRLNLIESARGKKRVKLVGKFSMNMIRYKNALRDILNSKGGDNLADDVKMAGFWVKAKSNKREVAVDELCKRILNVIDMGEVECVVIVSKDSAFLNVLMEAKSRRLKTIVFGDSEDGVLKTIADVAYSWKDVMVGRVRKRAVAVLGRWKDHDVLESLEWSYNPETEKTR